MSDWHIFQGNNKKNSERLEKFLNERIIPPWRDFTNHNLSEDRGKKYIATQDEIDIVNAALYLRRPILVTGMPGTGKSSLAYAVAYELDLGEVLYWPINSRSTLTEGLYHYDAISRLREEKIQIEKIKEQGTETVIESANSVAKYLRLGPLGTALYPSDRPRVLLIDEIDKSDIDLPGDLLHVFEEGKFEISELVRIAEKTPDVRILPSDKRSETDKVKISGGLVQCTEFPLIIMTSNGEREFPPAFNRRCLRLGIAEPNEKQLKEIVNSHLKEVDTTRLESVLEEFLRQKGNRTLATDQLLSAVFLIAKGTLSEEDEKDRVLKIIFQSLTQE